MEGWMEKPLLTTIEVAELLGFHPSTIALWARIGFLDGIRISGKWRFTERNLDSFVAERGLDTLDHIQQNRSRQRHIRVEGE